RIDLLSDPANRECWTLQRTSLTKRADNILSPEQKRRTTLTTFRNHCRESQTTQLSSRKVLTTKTQRTQRSDKILCVLCVFVVFFYGFCTSLPARSLLT